MNRESIIQSTGTEFSRVAFFFNADFSKGLIQDFSNAIAEAQRQKRPTADSSLLSFASQSRQ